MTLIILKILPIQGLKSILKFSLVLLDISWHPTLWFQDNGICWNGCLPSTSVFRGVQCISNFIWRIPCKCTQFCSRLSAGADNDLNFFHVKPPQNKKLPRSWLWTWPSFNSSWKPRAKSWKNIQQNRHRFNFRWILWIRFFLFFEPLGS